MADSVFIFTDGACRGNPGPGGWGAILRYGTKERELYGAEPETTNNRMELTAAIESLEALERPCGVVLTTDSEYLRKGMTEWLPQWKRRGWKTADNKPVKNQELWDEWTEINVRSAFYDVEGFKRAPPPLDALVREGLGPLAGLSVLHLQCHFGLDTLRLAREAREAVGVDVSEKAIAFARGHLEGPKVAQHFGQFGLFEHAFAKFGIDK